MQTFNFFLVATALLVTASATVLEKRSWVLAGIGALGGWITFWFIRLDRGDRQPVDAGEAVIMPLERRLSETIGIAVLCIIESAKATVKGGSRYSRVIAAIQGAVFLAFVLDAVYALSLGLESRRPVFD